MLISINMTGRAEVRFIKIFEVRERGGGFEFQRCSLSINWLAVEIGLRRHQQLHRNLKLGS